MRKLFGDPILTEVDDSGRRTRRPAQIEGVESGCLDVEVHQKNAVPSPSEFDSHVVECQRPAYADLERIEGGDVHGGQLASLSRKASRRARSSSETTSLQKNGSPC